MRQYRYGSPKRVKIENFTYGQIYTIKFISANRIGVSNPWEMKGGDILMKAPQDEPEPCIVGLTYLTKVQTMLRLREHHQSLMSTLQLDIILLNKPEQKQLLLIESNRWQFGSY